MNAAQPPSGDNGLELYDDKGPATSGPAAGGKPDAPVWYVAKLDGQREGPLPLAILRGRAASGQLRPTDLIWTQGFTDWMPARGVPDLYGPSLGASPPATTPTNLPGAIPAGMIKELLAGIASPGFLRTTGRIFGVLALLMFLASLPLWFINYSCFTEAFFFAVLFIAGEVSAAIIESQRRIESRLPSREETREAGK